MWTAWEWGRPFFGLCHAPRGWSVSPLHVGAFIRPADPFLPHSLWGSLDRLGCSDQEMRWVMHLKVMCACAQAVEMKEFKHLLPRYYCSVLQEIHEK